jgi:hypothetical protein
MEQSIVFAGMTTVIGAGISVRATLAAIGPPLRAKLAFAERRFTLADGSVASATPRQVAWLTFVRG